MSEMFNHLDQEIQSLEDLVKQLEEDPKKSSDKNQNLSDWIESDGLALDIVPSAKGHAEPSPQAITFATGSLTIEQLTAIFSTMPVDLTFVDADDRVRFVSEGPNRVFIRPKTIIGRKVHNCHPPESVDRVEQILADFRSGAQSIADFWLNFKDRFVLIRYFALRDQHNTYLGTLEVTQDLTNERALVGERRLLEYDSAQ